MDFNEVQPRKVSFSILVTLLGIVTEVKPLQPSNSFSSMRVTLSGMVMEVKLEQPLNADFPILFTP